MAVLAVLLLALTASPALRARGQHLTSGALGAIAGWVTPRDDALREAKEARIRAEARAAAVSDADHVVDEASKLSRSFAASGRDVVTARVVAFTPATTAGDARRVQIDAGRDAGIETSQAVVAAGGLVGRVTAVDEHAATVTLITDPASVVGARLEPGGTLARVSGAAPDGVAARAEGSVSLVLAAGGSATKGARVVTAGSPQGRPYPAGLPIGTVTSIDPDRGRLERSATVRPAVDPSSLDVVGVLRPRASR